MSDDARPVRRYRAPCPHCGNAHDVQLRDDEADATYRFECLSCGEPFAWLATEAALIGPEDGPGGAEEAEDPDGRGDRRQRFRGRAAAPFTPTAWVAGVAAGAGLLLATPAELVPVWAGPWIVDMVGFGGFFELVPAAMVLAVLLAAVWLFTYLTMLLIPQLERAMGVVQGVLSGAIVGYALVLPVFVWRLDRWFATVEAGSVWGAGTAALGAAALALAYLRRERAEPWTLRAGRLGVGLLVLGAAGYWVGSATFGTDEPPRVVQVHLAGSQLDAAREAAATATTEAERARADELFSEAGMTASRSGDLSQLEEALDAYIEFAEEGR